MDGSVIASALALALAKMIFPINMASAKASAKARAKASASASANAISSIKVFCASIALLFLSSCNVTEVELIDLPENTPPQAAIYIAGNFNEWNPGDERYRMTYRPSTNSYYTMLPAGAGSIEYKFTRGDWTSVEADSCGREIANRKLNIDENSFSRVRIENWSDLNPNFCDYVTLCIEEVPPGTTDSVFIAGDFNQWDLSDEQFAFVPQGTGPWHVIVPKTLNGSFYKFHRGSWKSGEIDDSGFPRKNRFAGQEDDSVYVKIDGWWDQLAEERNALTFEIIGAPSNTPENASFYLASSQFNWEESREELKFERNQKGTYTLTIPRVDYRFSYKINRGNWATVESDSEGNDITNRSYLQGAEDTVQLTIEGWLDLAGKR